MNYVSTEVYEMFSDCTVIEEVINIRKEVSVHEKIKIYSKSSLYI